MEKTNGFFKTFKYIGLLFFIVFCLLGTVGVESNGDNISPAASDNGLCPDTNVPGGETAFSPGDFMICPHGGIPSTSCLWRRVPLSPPPTRPLRLL